MAEYLNADPNKLNFHDCLCNILTFSRHLSEAAEEDDCQKNLNTSKEKKIVLFRAILCGRGTGQTRPTDNRRTVVPILESDRYPLPHKRLAGVSGFPSSRYERFKKCAL
jgi:hypothetical protein